VLRQTDACCHGAAVFYKQNRWPGPAPHGEERVFARLEP
jgi:hypothetical protein